MIFLVVDINVIYSALLGKGDSSEVFKINKSKKRFNFIAPYFLYIELGKHSSEMAQRTNYSLEEAEKVLVFIENQIRFVPEENYANKINEAKEILKEHQKDVPYLALALKFNCNIFSGDKVFKELCPEIEKNPKEILEELNK